MQNSFNQDLYVRKTTVPKVTHYGQERTIPGHSIATCPECLPVRLVRVALLVLMPIEHESEKHGKKHGSVLVESL